jgi:hypothetical protein
MARTILDVLASVRSKNAGPFSYTFDLFFDDRATYDDVVARDVISRAKVAALYGLQPDQVKVFAFEPALAIKVSIPRPFPGGDPADTDTAGGQQFAPLLDIEL